MITKEQKTELIFQLNDLDNKITDLILKFQEESGVQVNKIFVNVVNGGTFNGVSVEINII